ncbi:Hypothetical_protein [Hexamita inflata]|uniref:Hypothetical_protein n=1 Tax=Hexamita inflata TaxID=28002 RepID=A0AA86R6B4_9EUKA|nr:Hypothetical protein HINF_LOCUS54502 [Hexamita inflata]
MSDLNDILQDPTQQTTKLSPTDEQRQVIADKIRHNYVPNDRVGGRMPDGFRAPRPSQDGQKAQRPNPDGVKAKPNFWSKVKDFGGKIWNVVKEPITGLIRNTVPFGGQILDGASSVYSWFKNRKNRQALK